MSEYCPKTEKACVDDVCRGTGLCAASRGRMPMIVTCNDCRQLEEFCICNYDDYECYQCGDVGCEICLDGIAT